MCGSHGWHGGRESAERSADCWQRSCCSCSRRRRAPRRRCARTSRSTTSMSAAAWPARSSAPMRTTTRSATSSPRSRRTAPRSWDSDGSVSYFAPFDFAGPDPFSVTVDDSRAARTPCRSASTSPTPPRSAGPWTSARRPAARTRPVRLRRTAPTPTATSRRHTRSSTSRRTAMRRCSSASLTYDPDDAYVGTDSFTYRVRDGVAWSAPATVTVELTNSAPDCSSPGTLTIRQDKPASAQVQCFDSENDPLQLIVVDQPAHGHVSGAPGPFNSLVATYDPDNGYRGTDHMRLRVSDGSLQSNAFDVDLVMTPQPRAGVLHGQHDAYARGHRGRAADLERLLRPGLPGQPGPHHRARPGRAAGARHARAVGEQRLLHAGGGLRRHR